MVVSVNTSASQMLALQALNRTTKDLGTAQLRVTTGLRVNGPKDDPAVFAIAQNLRGEIAGIGAVKKNLALGESTVDVAIDGATAVSDLLTEMKAKRSKQANLVSTRPRRLRCTRSSRRCGRKSRP